MSTDPTFLAITEITYLSDGAYVDKETQLFWVSATNKQSAAATAVRYIRRTTTRTLASVKVIHVMANSQWGSAYLTQIRECDEAQHQQSQT